MLALWRDARSALRFSAKNKAFAALAVFVVALGIGPNTVIFSIIYATLFEPPDWGHAEQVMMLWTTTPQGVKTLVATPDYLAWKREADCFSDMQAAVRTTFTLRVDEPELIEGMQETPGMWRFFGQKMILGRDLVAEDAVPGKNYVALLAHRVWTTRFGADRHIIGKTVRMNGAQYTIVGVRGGGQADRDWNQITVPLVITPAMEQDRQSRDVVVVGRLKPGRTLQQAQAQLQAIMNRLGRDFPQTNRGLGSKVEPFWNDFLPQRTRATLWLLMGAVGLVLLIACVNVSSLLLSRGSARQKELAVRAALGASRWPLFRQLTVEALTLALAGGVLGLVLSFALLRSVMAMIPEGLLPIEAEVRISIPVLAFTAICTVLSGTVFGSVPAWNVTRNDLAQTLAQTGRSIARRRTWAQQALVVFEFSLAVVLLMAASLTIHSLWKLSSMDLGVRTDHILSFYLPLDQKRYAAADVTAAFYRTGLSSIESVPGVERASIGTGTPITGSGSISFSIPGHTLTENHQLFTGVQLITPGYLQVYGLRILQGRGFTEADRMGSSRVVLVNQTFARRFLSGAEPIGMRIQTPDISGEKSSDRMMDWQIVGVYKDSQHLLPWNREAGPEIYLPFWQAPIRWGVVAVRTAADPLAIQKRVSAAIHSLPLAQVRTIDQVRAESLASDRFTAILYGSFAVLALLLASAGIYGVMAYSVSQRIHEIGVRAAVGAQANELLRMMLVSGMKLSVVGLGVGLVAGMFVCRAMQSMLFGIGAIDAPAMAAVIGMLLLSALAACYIPARRATKVDPLVALSAG